MTEAVPGSPPDRRPRADAVRNRARVLDVAYETFAADGLAVPIDEIARRAGVGAGTVYRHFPTKDALFRAVVEDRILRIVAQGRALLEREPRGEALFAFLRALVLSWGATDRGLSEALAGSGIDVGTAIPGAEAGFMTLLGDLLRAAQDAGVVRTDIAAPQIKALLVGLQAVQEYADDAADRIVEVVLDGLRTR